MQHEFQSDPGVRALLRRAPAVAMALALLLAAGAGVAWAQRPSGTVTLAAGQIKLGRFGEETVYRDVGKPIAVYEGDIIQTGPGSRAEVALSGGVDKVQMYPNSFLRVETVQPQRMALGLNIGKALFAFLHRAQSDKLYAIRSQTMVLGVKGTEFALGSDEEKSYVLALEGVVTAQNLERPDAREVTLTKDQVYFVARGKKPLPPVKINEATREAILKDEGLETFQRVERSQEAPPALSVQWNLRPYVHAGPISFAVDFKSAQLAFTDTITANNAHIGFEAYSSLHLALDVAAYAGKPETLSRSGDISGSSAAEGQFAVAVVTVMGAANLGPLRLRGGAGFFMARLDVAPQVSGPPAQRRSLELSGPLVQLGLDVTFFSRVYLGLVAFGGTATNSSGTLLEATKLQGLKPENIRINGASAILGLSF